MYNILMGNMFNLLDKLPCGYYDALITDPPYSSQIGERIEKLLSS